MDPSSIIHFNTVIIGSVDLATSRACDSLLSNALRIHAQNLEILQSLPPVMPTMVMLSVC